MTLIVDDVYFFPNPESCLRDYKERHWGERVVSSIQSFGTLFVYFLYRISLILRRTEVEMDSFIRTGDRDLSKKRLVVCVHGLNNNPSQFKKIVDEMEKQDLSDTDIFIPRVLEKGNAKLDEMVAPIFTEIEKWVSNISEGDENKLVLVGISNGGRISRAIEVKIAKSELAKKISTLHFVSIVGACKGSSLADFAKKVGLSWLMSKNISEEMPTYSKRSKSLDMDWQNALNLGPKRQYTFFASPHDWQVPNCDSTLMETNNIDANYALIPGHGHNSIVNAVAKPVVKFILNLI